MASGGNKKNMDYFLQQLINGVTLGSIYGLIAIGYTMVTSSWSAPSSR